MLGAPIDWTAVWSQPGHKVVLPTYPFETQRYWFTPSPATVTVASTGDRVADDRVHPLLGRRLDLAGHEIVYETELSTDSFLQDHCVGDRIVFPATGYLELALAAGQDAGFKLLDVCQLKIRRPLELETGSPTRLQVVLAPQEADFACRILCRQADGTWRLHATCNLANTGLSPFDESHTAASSVSSPVTAGTPFSVDLHYQRCDQLGLHYGPAFQGLRQLRRGDGEAWGQVRLPQGVEHHGYLLHPALLDACLQVTAGALREEQAAAWLPVKVQGYRVFASDLCDTQLQVHVRCSSSGADPQSLTADIVGTALDNRLVFQIAGLQLQRVQLRNLEELTFHDRWISHLRLREHTPTIPELSITDVARHMEVCRTTIAAETGLAKHTEVLDAMETLSGQIIFETLWDNFRPLQQQIAFTTEEAADALGVTPLTHDCFSGSFASSRKTVT